MVESIEQRLKKDGKLLQKKTLRLGQPDEVTWSCFVSPPVWAIFLEDGSRFGKLKQVFRKPEAAAEKWLELTEENQGILDFLETSDPEDSFKEKIISTAIGIPITTKRDIKRYEN